MVDKVLDIIAKWDGLGQGLFLFLVLIGCLTSINFIAKMIAVVVRGWPPVEYEDDEDECGDTPESY